MAREFVVFPKTLADDGCPAASTLFAVHKAIDPIVRFFLTDSLTRLRLTNLRPFMQAERYDENSLAEF